MKKRKLDQFLNQRKKQPDVILGEKTQLANRVFRFLVAATVTVLAGFLAVAVQKHRVAYSVGLGALLLMLLQTSWLLLRRLDPGSLDRPSSFNKFVLLVTIAVGLHWLVIAMEWSPFLAPVPMFAMVLALAYGLNTAIISVLAFCFYVGLTSWRLDGLYFDRIALPPDALNFPLDVPLTLALLVGGLACILGMKRLRKQSKLVITGLLGGTMQAVTILACKLMGYGFSVREFTDAGRLPDLLIDSGWSLAGGLIAGGIVTSLLPAIESFFDILTERRLLDLADPSNELLRVLRERAPGTYQHTLGVAQLASNAAEAIGANRLLAEVGAYYHDIGKIFKPEYFVENMGEDKTIHERLRPNMSKMVIISHVKDGMELAWEAGLPEKIVDMIPMHHGTTVVEYFYQKARRELGEEDEGPVETEYRYPGSKPRFREAGILMLSDMVEAIAKTETEPNPSRFRTMVHDQILKRLLDGQLDESDLTLNDLRVIEDSFVRTLTTMYHSRIKYPAQDAGRAALPRAPVVSGEVAKPLR